MSVKPGREKWQGTMTDRERFNCQMHYQPVDRCFNMEFGYWNENFERWPLFADNGIKNNWQADVFLAFDIIKGISGNIWMHPVYPPRIVEERQHTRVIMNPDGLLAEVPKDDHDTIPHFLQASVVTPDDWKRCKEERFRRDDPERSIDVEQLRARHPSSRDYPLGVNCGSMIGKVRDMLTFEGLAYACYDYPDMVEDMVETCGEEQFVWRRSGSGTTIDPAKREEDGGGKKPKRKKPKRTKMLAGNVVNPTELPLAIARCD